VAGALSPEEARAVFSRRVEAWLRGDVDAYLDCWHDDLLLTLPGGGEIRGRAAYRRVVERSLRWAEPLSFTVHHLGVDGGVILADWTIVVARRADGVRVGWDGLSVCEVVDGRIRWWREHHVRPPEPLRG
jgi:ketosteroid isomerase-like protein